MSEGQPTFTLDEIKARFILWVKRHPDVWQANESQGQGRLPPPPHFWWVQNAVGDLIDWVERPDEWVADIAPPRGSGKP